MPLAVVVSMIMGLFLLGLVVMFMPVVMVVHMLMSVVWCMRVFVGMMVLFFLPDCSHYDSSPLQYVLNGLIHINI
ncbi:hypothetical protein D3C75_1053240 [compost metagenome]